MKFGQLMLHYKRNFFIKKFYEKCDLEKFQALFNFQKNVYKKESGEVSVLIWTNFDSLADIYLI